MFWDCTQSSLGSVERCQLQVQSYCQCRPNVGVSWTHEITVDNLYSKLYLQNYIHVTKNVLKRQKVQPTTTACLSHCTPVSQLSPPGHYLDDLASTRSVRAWTTCPSQGPRIISPSRSASRDDRQGWPLSGSVNKLRSVSSSSSHGIFRVA